MSKTFEFEIDAEGNLTSVDFGGFVGPECEAAQKVIEALTGKASKEVKKPEYHRKVVRKQQVGGS